MAIGDVFMPAPAPQPSIGSGPKGGSVNLGAAFAPEQPVVAPPPTAPRAGGMGAAAAQVFPTVAALPVDTEGVGTRPVAPAPRAEPDAPAPPPRPLSALEQAQMSNQATGDVLSEYLAANPVQVRTSANPKRPLVEQEAQFFKGGGQLEVEPFVFVPPDIPRNEGETDEEYAARVELFNAASYQGQLESYQRNVAQQQAEAQQLGDVRDIGKAGHLGMGEAKIQAAERLGDAQIEQQLAVTVAQQQAAEAQRAAIEAARQADAERRAFAQQQRDAIKQLQETEKAARAKVEALPELDPQRFFKSQTGAQKFWTVLASALGGWAGHDVAGSLRAEAEADLEAQKANASQAFAQLDEAEGAVTEASTLYQDLLRGAGDERIADSMWIKLQMEDAATSLEEVLAKTTEPVLRAQLDQDLVNLREQIQAEDQKINYALATEPHTVSTTYDPIGRRQRKRIEERIDTLDERGFELTKAGIAREGKSIEREADAAIKREEMEIKAARGEGGYQKEAWAFAEKAAPYVAVNASLSSIIDEYKDKDVPGRGLSAYFWSEAGRALREDIKETMRRQLRSESGAVIGEDELEDRFESAYSGLGDTELLGNLERLRNFNARYTQSLKAGISDDAANFYDSNLAKRTGIGRGVQAVTGSPDQDAARLGAKVVR